MDGGLMRELGIDMEEIRRRMAFVGFLERDVRLLSEMEGLIHEHADRLVEAFYQHLLSFEETRAFLKDQSTIERLMASQRKYLLSIFQGNFDGAYFEGRLRIGAVHHRIGLPPRWYIGAYCLYENYLSPLIAEAYRGEPDGGLARIMALSKVFRLDMALAMDFDHHRMITLLEQTIRERDEFTHVVAHDLKEPLRGVEAFSSFLLEDYATHLDEQGKRYLSFLKESAVHMKDLIDDLLTLASLSQKGPNIQKVDLNQVLTQVQHDIEYSIKQKGAEIRVLSPLPVVLSDPIWIGEIFKNLLSNAIKFNASTFPRVEIGVQEESLYLFSIKDNGIGIHPDHIDHIFLPFKRLHSREEYEGTGVGLAICKKVIENLGGRIWAESRQGVGSTFFFTLPKKLD